MKEPRIKSTEKERIATNALGFEDEYTSINMRESDVNDIIDREKINKFNDEVEKYQAQLEENQKTLEEAQKSVNYDINKAEIKPMFSRVIIKPFKVNPFQKMQVKGSLIVDAGGYTPHVDINPMTGKYEEQDQFIKTGCVVEVGPETKYLKEEDVVYYRADTAVPIPFLKQGFVSIDEKQIIAVVAVSLSERFNQIKNCK